MVIRYTLALVMLSLSISSIYGQNAVLSPNKNESKLIDRGIEPTEAHVFEIPIDNVMATLNDAPHYKTQKGVKGIDLDLVLPNGMPIIVQLHEAPVSHPSHYAKYPNNKTYKITGANNAFISGRLAISPQGLSGLIHTEIQTVFIESIDGDQHVSYIYTKDERFGCDAENHEDTHQGAHEEISSTRSINAFGDEILEYDIAIASSGEWSNERNDNLAVINADINTYLSALNAIYERELAITFILIADNDDIIFFDPVTDGLNPNSRTASAHSVISGAIPSADYDIGHVFYEIPGSGTSGSGVAGLGVTCNNSRKAEGWTGFKGSYSVANFLGVFAHEVGHQFDAPHSFYGTSNFCSGFNRFAGQGFEPGSGNSLMSYEALCQANGSCNETQNITPTSSTTYFHTKSVDRIMTYISNNTCADVSTSGNTPPVVTVPSNKHIPKGTPFEMSGSATDANGDALVYHWEECDTDSQTLSCPDGDPDAAATSTTAPLFRSFDPSAGGNYRSFPQNSDLMNNVQTKGEILPTIGRDIKLRLVARDFNTSAGGVDCEEVTLTVDGNSGPFEVTVANGPDPAYQSGETVTITWDVNNTASSPINCTNVEILFSTDGGMTYPITLAASTTNDGSHTVDMPSNGTSQGRIKIKAIGNYFFDVNDENITILSDCVVEGGAIINTDLVTADAGDPTLDLMLQSGVELTQMAGTLETSDPSADFNCENISTNACVSFSNAPRYQLLKITVDVTGDYTFSTSSTYYNTLNIYENSYNTGNVCTNWLASSSDYDPNTGFVTLNNTVTENLTAGTTYVLKFSAYFSSNTGAYTVSFSNNISGKIYDPEGTSPAGYTSSYVVVDDSNSNIKGIDSSPDMTDDNVYSGGDYTVHGLSHLSSIDLTSYINGSFSALETNVLNGTVCGEFTSNTKDVTVNGCTPAIKTVTSISDSGVGSLRLLMADACPGDMIVFSNSIPSNSNINLLTEIVIDRIVTIDGNAVDGLTLSGGFTSRIFQIPNGFSLSLENISLKNGFSNTNGGAFYNLGQVNLSDVIFENNFDGNDIAPFTGDGEIIIESGEVLIKD